MNVLTSLFLRWGTPKGMPFPVTSSHCLSPAQIPLLGCPGWDRSQPTLLGKGVVW